MKIIWGVIIAVFAFVLLAIVFGDSDEQSEPANGTDERSDAALACDHFRNIIGDIENGVLTDEEFRDKLKEVDDNAAIAPANVQASAQAMLSAATGNSANQMRRAVRQMDTACESHGD